MNKLLDLDPFIAYQASAMLQEYIKQGCANYVLDSLNVHIDDATDPRILDLVHALMKFTRSQMKKGIEMDPNHLCRLLNLVIGDNGSRSGMFDSIDCPTAPHLIFAIDLFKNEQITREYCPNLNIYGSVKAVLSADDIAKVAKCVESSSIIAVRKGLELLWRNANTTSDACTIVATLLVANAYLVAAFDPCENTTTLLAQNETEFYHSPLPTRVAIDRESLKRAVKVCLAAFIASLKLVDSGALCHESHWSVITTVTGQMCEHIKSYCYNHGKTALVDLFITICGNEDNDMIAIQHGLQEIGTLAHRLNSGQNHSSSNLSFESQVLELVDPEDSNSGLKHAELFLHFLFRMGLDHTTLLDMLISQDTQFLRFFLQFLRYIEENTDDFKIACSRAAVDLLHSDDSNEDDMSDGSAADTQMLEIVSEILDALRLDLQMSEFPYNPQIMINRLQRVIDKLMMDV
ncbi:unnamed protein product [Umbelopsis vinacea]